MICLYASKGNMMYWIFWSKLNTPEWSRRALSRRLETSVHF